MQQEKMIRRIRLERTVGLRPNEMKDIRERKICTPLKKRQIYEGTIKPY